MLIAESDSQGHWQKEYIYVDTLPMAMIDYSQSELGEVYYIHSDHLATPKLATNSAKTTVWQANYTAFGIGIVNYDVDGDGIQMVLNLRFPGQYFDKESNLHYNWHRYYDPNIGRYIQSDPIGLAGGINTYIYAANNPIIYTDPTGEIVPQLVGFFIGAGLEALTNSCASAGDILLAGALGTLGGGLSKAAFLNLGAKSLTKETGKEWSHTIPRRNVNRHTSGAVKKYLNRRGVLNGSWRLPASHARHDAHRHVAGVNPMPAPLRALDRVPYWLKGTVAGGAGGAAVAGGECGCD